MKTLKFLAIFLLVGFNFSTIAFAEKEDIGDIQLKPEYQEIYEEFKAEGDWVKIMLHFCQKEGIKKEKSQKIISFGIAQKPQQKKLFDKLGIDYNNKNTQKWIAICCMQEFSWEQTEKILSTKCTKQKE